MILQNIIFPKTSGAEYDELYFRLGGTAVFFEQDKRIVLKKGDKLSFNTYFGSFSVEKWNKYTSFDALSLELDVKGEFVLEVVNYYFDEKKIPQKKSIYIDDVSSDGTIVGAIPQVDKGIIYFTLTAKTDCVFYGGRYVAEPTNCVRNVSLAAVICTYKREKFVCANMDALRVSVFENENSPLYGKLKVIISDNGNSLPEELKNDNIFIFPNKNVGGAGGFARALAEAGINNGFNFTHAVIMDDDVIFETEIFVRIYALLCLLREDYKDAFIGGAMFRTDKKNVQNELATGMNWKTGRVYPMKHMFDMCDEKNLLKNEIEEPLDYLSWWLCCIPMNVVTKSNLPLPLFIKRDDIEYGLRNGKTFITVNGISVWHEPFETKRPAFLEYYYTRNYGIIASVYDKSFNKTAFKKLLLKQTLKSIFTFRYDEARIRLIGAEDFCKGIEFLKTKDPEALHKYVSSLGYKNVDLAQLSIKFDPNKYIDSDTHENKIKAVIRKLTLNGWLFPSTKDVIIKQSTPRGKDFFLAKRALNYDAATNRGFVTKKSYEEAINCLLTYRKVCKIINKRFEISKQEYKTRIGELTTLEFWNKYLGITPDSSCASDVTVDKAVEAKVAWTEKRNMFGYKVLRIAERLISFVLPINNKKITVAVNERKGYTCNPKYVIEALRKKYGEKYKIIWVTQHPKTCDELINKGIKVVKDKSKTHILSHLTSKVILYNDYLPAYLIKRKGQKYINTWHGAINYKHIGYQVLPDKSKLSQKRYAMRNPEPDYFISGSGFFTDDTAESFRFAKNTFIECGLPRNDILFDEESYGEISKKVKAYYGIDENNKLVLYAPTFRESCSSDTHGIDFNGLTAALKDKFGGEWSVLYRGHSFVDGKAVMPEFVIDASNYCDMQELLIASDALVSDYSSIMWDMSFTNRPVFVFAPDMKSYTQNDRSFAYPLAKWPYSIAENNEELIKNIENFDEKSYNEKIKAHHNDARSFENANSSETVADIIDGICAKKGN